MIRRIAITAAVCMSVAACAGTSATQVETDMQAVLTDAGLIAPTLPPPASTDGALVIAGLQALLTTYEQATSSGASTETQAVAELTTAVQRTMADLPSNAVIQSYGAKALAALAALSASSGQSAIQQAYAVAGAFLINSLASMTTPSASPHSVIEDAYAHLHAIGG